MVMTVLPWKPIGHTPPLRLCPDGIPCVQNPHKVIGHACRRQPAPGRALPLGMSSCAFPTCTPCSCGMPRKVRRRWARGRFCTPVPSQSWSSCLDSGGAEVSRECRLGSLAAESCTRCCFHITQRQLQCKPWAHHSSCMMTTFHASGSESVFGLANALQSRVNSLRHPHP